MKTFPWKPSKRFGLSVAKPKIRILGFATDSPNRFEGFHGNVFIILDECKSIDETLFEAVARIQPSRILAMSSPGGTTGKFYKIFSKEQKWWKLHTVTAFDCPHIKQSWVDEQMEMWGKDHPLIRSMIFGEFQETSGEGLVVPWDTLMQCLDSPPNKEGHDLLCWVDYPDTASTCPRAPLSLHRWSPETHQRSLSGSAGGLCPTSPSAHLPNSA